MLRNRTALSLIYAIPVALFMTDDYSRVINGLDSLVIANQPIQALTIPLCWILIYYAYSYIKFDSLSLIFAGIFSVFINFGLNMHTHNMLLPGTYSKTGLAVLLIRFVGLFIASNLALNFINDNLKLKSSHGRLPTKRMLWIVLAVTVVTRVFVFWVYYPGPATPDLVYQIFQTIGFRPLTNAHPWYVTLAVGWIVKIGQFMFGSIRAGYTLFVLVVMTMNIVIVYLLQRYIVTQDIPKYFKLLAVFHYNFSPVILVYGLIGWKDNLLGLFTPVLVFFSYRMVYEGRSFFTVKKTALYVSSLLVFTAAKLTSLVSLLLFIPLLAWLTRGKARQLALVWTIIPVAIFLSFNVAILNAAGIPGGKKYDKMSLPLQQIGRTLSHNLGSIPREELRILSEVLPVDQVAREYSEWVSDPVKESFDYDRYVQNRRRYIQAWVELGTGYPIPYAEALFSGSYKYYIPTYRDNLPQGSYLSNIRLDWFSGHDTHPYPEDEARRLDRVEGFETGVKLYCSTPLLSLTQTIGFYTWICGIGLFVALRQRKHAIYPAYGILAGVLIGGILSPINGEMRYAWGLIMSAPIVLLFSLYSFPVRTGVNSGRTSLPSSSRIDEAGTSPQPGPSSEYE